MRLPELPPFAEVFRAVNGFSPYPWQDRLCRKVVSEGRWPDTIGVPTGTGKTATLDIALYALASDAGRPPGTIRAPRRIVMVVDRRTIVDQSFTQARTIRDKLVSARSGPLVAMRVRLNALMGGATEGEEPIQIALMRGGVPRDDGWARRPDQALLAVSTVDQVGSRLLFRGYGVRPTMASVHAGLLGEDTLLLLDEVHLARPFHETLAALATRWRSWGGRLPSARWQAVSLSATSGAQDVFRLGDADRSLPRLARRLTASKPVTTVLADSTTHTKQKRTHPAWTKRLVAETLALLNDQSACVGVVVNRVDTARQVAAQLARKEKFEVQLVTGRMRSADRALAAKRLRDRAGPGWRGRRDSDERPYVCVATQTIEAGADLDFDGMVTEVASLDALVQRFGRANRTGDHQEAPIVVVAPKDVASIVDPIYGSAQTHAWAWLQQQGGSIDARLDQLGGRLSAAPEEALAPRELAAVLAPAHIDLLCQTAPRPEPDPDPALYLHGLKPPLAEVQLIWRADIDATLAPDEATDRLATVPPTSFEALSLPIGAAKRWLAGLDAVSFADVGGDTDDAYETTRQDGPPVGFAWDGTRAMPVAVKEIRPGQTVVLPVHAGGLAHGNFSPEKSDGPVTDVGDLGRTISSGRAIVRLDLRVYGQPDATGTLQWPAGFTAPPTVPDGTTRSVREARRELAGWVSKAPTSGTELATLLAHLAAAGFRASVIGQTWVLTARRRLDTAVVLDLAQGELAPPGDHALTADDASAVSADPVPLRAHLDRVANWVSDLAAGCGVPTHIAADLALAARFHDLGKAHPSFQTLLHDGDEIRAAAGPLLAKSGRTLADQAARHRARERAKLPGGFRHEMVSVALLTETIGGRAALNAAHDPELVLHLVASHHGHARPFAPPEDHSDLPATEVRVEMNGEMLAVSGDHKLDRADSGLADRFWTLQRRYGWWTLAWLEAIVRLADHRASEAEERQREEQS